MIIAVTDKIIKFNSLNQFNVNTVIDGFIKLSDNIYH